MKQKRPSQKSPSSSASSSSSVRMCFFLIFAPFSCSRLTRGRGSLMGGVVQLNHIATASTTRLGHSGSSYTNKNKKRTHNTLITHTKINKKDKSTHRAGTGAGTATDCLHHLLSVLLLLLNVFLHLLKAVDHLQK